MNARETEAGRREVLALAMPTARRFLPALGLGILASACAIALLATSAWLITRAAEQPPILYLSFAIVGVRAFALGRAFFRYLERLTSHDAAFRTLGAVRVGVFERLVRVGPAGLTRLRRGDVLARFVDDVDRLQDLPLRIVQPLATALVVVLASVGALALVQPAAATVLAIALVVAVAAAMVVQSRVAGASDEAIAALRGEARDAALTHLQRLDVLRAFDAERESRERLETVQARLALATRSRALGTAWVAAISSLAAGMAVLGSLLVAGPSLAGPWLAVVVLTPIAVFEAVGAVPGAVSAWREVRAAADRVAAVVPSRRAPELPVPPARAVPLPAGPVLLELEGVSARWPGGAGAVLDRIRLRVAPGDCVVVSGPSGVGKSTLANVLVRLLDYSGSYRVNGVEARRLNPDDVRRVVGLCEQHPHLFDESVRQNLLFAREDATDQELIGVLERVGLAGWLAERGGLDAAVGERGALVSGGQAQRIALARALLADFPVLVLDEPTANVDAAVAGPLVDDLVRAAVEGQRAVVLITHLPVNSPSVTQQVTLSALTAGVA